MKKSILNLGKALNRKQQQLVFGGREDDESGTCAYVVYNGDGEILVEKNVSKSTAMSIGQNWCCDSCDSASWIDSCNIC